MTVTFLKTPAEKAAEALFGNVVALHAYLDDNGACMFVRVRRSKAPKVLPMRFDVAGQQWVRGEPTEFNGCPKGKKPLYGLDRLKRTPGMVWLVEGEKCVDALTDVGVLATTSGSASSAAKADWTPLKEREVRIWPDLDEPGQRYALACVTALRRVGARVSVIDSGKTGLKAKGADVVDWLAAHPKAAVRDVALRELLKLPLLELAAPSAMLVDEEEDAPIEQSKPIEPEIIELDGGGRMAKIGPVTYVVKQDGLFAREERGDGGRSTTFIGAPIHVIAQTRSNNGDDWGRLVEWFDPDGRKHSVAIPVSLAYGDSVELVRFLASQGFRARSGAKVRSLLENYLISWPVKDRAVCTSRVGWCGDVYVTPERIVGQSEKERIVYQPTATVAHGLSHKGHLDGWKDGLAELARGNSRIMLAISAAFAGPLLRRTGTPGGGLHLYGDSSSGKSNAVRAAASVWGFHKDLMRQWRATDNGLEALAESANDGLLMLDEIKQLDVRLVGAAAYMLANGQGKARMTKGLVVRPPAAWELIFLSSGEHTLQQMMLEAGQKTATGQALRIPSIPCDLGPSGLVEDLHGFRDSKAFMQAGLEPALGEHYGHAGQAWLDRIVPDIDIVSRRALELRDRFVAEALNGSSNGQIARVATRFGILAAAGELATEAGITGWLMGEAWAGCLACFRAWLALEGPTQERATENALLSLRGVIEQQIAAFPDLQGPIDKLQRSKILGYRRHKPNGDTEFLVNRKSFDEELCGGKHPGEIKKLLKEKGWLLPGHGGRDLQFVATPFSDRQWFYVLSEDVISAQL